MKREEEIVEELRQDLIHVVNGICDAPQDALNEVLSKIEEACNLYPDLRDTVFKDVED